MTDPLPPNALDVELGGRLAALAGRGLARARTLPAGRDFASNDYLGFARDPELARAIAARVARRADESPESLFAPASRLLRGETELHRGLEARLAAWKGAEAALLFPSGFQANLALLTALIGPDDRVLSDELNHASLIDALRLARCRREIVPHLDLAAYDAVLARPHAPGRTFVVVEALYGMDGDLAPLAELAGLCERHGADLLVDEAHAAGLHGPRRGSGRVEELGLERRVAATVTTFGKALALQGAAVAGSARLVDWLAQTARPFLFSTALSPLLVLALDAALDRLAATPERRDLAGARARQLREALAANGLARPGGESAIVPVVLGDNVRALAVAGEVRAEGFDVRAVRPPTVPEGTARLRLSVHADHTAEEIDRLAGAIARAAAKVDP